MDAVASDIDKESPTKNAPETPTKETPEITEEMKIEEEPKKVSGNVLIWGCVWAESAHTHRHTPPNQKIAFLPHCTQFVHLLLIV